MSSELDIKQLLNLWFYVMSALKYFAFFIFIIITISVFIGEKTKYHIIEGKIFGTYYVVKIRTNSKDKLLNKIISNELANINAKMSVFNSNSEISKINHSNNNEWIKLSKDMQHVLKNAYRIYKLSDGAFDPTTGNLVDLWGFGITEKTNKQPSNEEILDILKITGFDKFLFNDDYSQLKKLNNNTTLNLSAIAKGYGVDRLAQLLKSKGYNDFIIEIGGEVIASGNKSNKINGWNVGVVKPSETTTENAFVITLKDYAVATSGDYRNFFYVEDKKYSHTINPKTGYPINNNLLSVTVFHESCMMADGLATAIMSLGKEKGLDFAKNNDIAVIMFIKTEDGKIKNMVSPRAKRLIEQ